MPWIPYNTNSHPEKQGEYFVLKFYPGLTTHSFFGPFPPKKKIELMIYKQKLRLENDFHDHCVYVKYNAWEDHCGLEQKPEEILYWYELDPIPEES